MAEILLPSDDNTLLQRKDAAAALSAAGYPIALPTLASMASRKEGPPFVKFGRRPLYRWGELLAWAERRSTPSNLKNEVAA